MYLLKILPAKFWSWTNFKASETSGSLITTRFVVTITAFERWLALRANFELNKYGLCNPKKEAFSYYSPRFKPQILAIRMCNAESPSVAPYFYVLIIVILRATLCWFNQVKTVKSLWGSKKFAQVYKIYTGLPPDVLPRFHTLQQCQFHQSPWGADLNPSQTVAFPANCSVRDSDQILIWLLFQLRCSHIQDITFFLQCWLR